MPLDNFDALERELLDEILIICQLVGEPPDGFNLDSPLIGPDSPLGMDSLDAVEVIFVVQKKYGARVDAEKMGRKIMRSLKTLAQFVRDHGER